jgi:hypothetical protein
MEKKEGKVLNTYRTQYFSISKILEIIDLFNIQYGHVHFKTYTVGNLSFYLEYTALGPNNDPMAITPSNKPKND